MASCEVLVTVKRKVTDADVIEAGEFNLSTSKCFSPIDHLFGAPDGLGDWDSEHGLGFYAAQ